uniref:Integrin alpha-2 domain-containing protein n=1 Tax=Gouania willdenowi TaxID=441366 RepID=A0A8C5EVU7_GOUWI
MSPRLLLCAVLAVYHGARSSRGFNIDDRFPVIKEGKTKGSFFGFSVALHQQTEGSSRHLLLIGAPREKALSLPNVNETGAVYSCPITTDSSDCSRMDLVSSTNPSEMVEGMWLGVTVASQRGQPGGRVLACGHRYVKVFKVGTDWQHRMIGKCYVRSNDLTFDPNDDWQIYSYERCNPNLDMISEGMCSMGISGGMTDTDVYVGAPGSYLWQGNVHVIWRDLDPLEVSGQFNLPPFTGYSVLEARKLHHDDYTVVAGSPRHDAKGAVMIGRKGSNIIELVQILSGEQVGSYFGSSVAVTDLNNDDWNDLIVGAPFYFDRMKDHGGAVYVFMNENGSFQNTATVVLRGPSDSGFGLAVAAIGDINQDGFQDFAVGAPFVDTGKVYIWMGSKQGISKEPSQVIEGKSVDKEGFHTFGYSISGGMDMDDSSYPDIVVGSLDDRIAKYIADVIKCHFLVFQFCKALNYTVEADVEWRRSPRVRFESNNDDTYNGLLSLPSMKSKCETMKLFVLAPVRDKLQPVVFSLNISLQEQKPKSRRSLQNLDSFPILSQGQKLTQRSEINFLKECGLDNKCSSNLQLTAQFVDNKDKPYLLQYSSAMKILRLKIEVTNFPTSGRLAEDAHQAMLNVTIPDGLTYSGFRRLCTLDDTVICELGNPLKGDKKVSLLVKFETKGISLYTKELEFNLEVFIVFYHQVNLKGEPLGEMGSLAVEFDWPFEVTNGKWLLYLTKIVVTGDSEMECNPAGKIVNLLNLTDCSMETAKCVTFTCPLLNMTNSAKIYVRSRLWNSTMLEDYSNALRVTVRGQATLKLITNTPTIKMDSQTTIFNVEIDPVEGVELLYELPLWIIISAAVAGVVLLGIIIVIMWKCGFFQRASRREMYEAKAQKAEMKIQPSDTERLTEDY